MTDMPNTSHTLLMHSVLAPPFHWWPSYHWIWWWVWHWYGHGPPSRSHLLDPLHTTYRHTLNSCFAPALPRQQKHTRTLTAVLSRILLVKLSCCYCGPHPHTATPPVSCYACGQSLDNHGKRTSFVTFECWVVSHLSQVRLVHTSSVHSIQVHV